MSKPSHAAPAKLFQGKAKHRITEVCLHTSATASNWWNGKTVEEMRDEIRDWHMNPPEGKQPWLDIGYHFVIAPDGSVATGRALTTIGAGVEGRNRGVIHICMIPRKKVLGITRFEDWYTPEQQAAVLKIIADLQPQTHLKLVSGHNTYANKLCPGFVVKSERWLKAA